ncbi:hypothetical protein ACIBL6_25610 [Streptomyces sp. NPDC050400]|uniref:hypothetical protein n=1 Tax=Streptomyces sp. NPDC050400 TaxID=3365610 RepID=UPI00378FBC95
MKRRPALAGLTMMLVAALAACGGGTDKAASSHGGKADSAYAGQHQDRQDRDDKVSGVRDAVRHTTRKTAKGTRPHYVKKCETETRKVKHTQRKKGRTRTWYTTDRYRDCDKVRKGTETYTRVVRPERWCVRLDDLNGKKAKDDVWFRVAPAVYSKVNGADDRTRVTFEPISKGC